MIRPSWLIFSSRGRQARISGIARNIVHRIVALIGGLLSLPIAIVTAMLIKLDSRGPHSLQTGTRGQKRRSIYGDEVSFDAH